MTIVLNTTLTTLLKRTVKMITLLLLIAAAWAARGAGIGPWHFGHSQQFLENNKFYFS